MTGPRCLLGATPVQGGRCTPVPGGRCTPVPGGWYPGQSKVDCLVLQLSLIQTKDTGNKMCNETINLPEKLHERERNNERAKNKSCVMNTIAGYVIMYIQNAEGFPGYYVPLEVINKLTLKRDSNNNTLNSL